MIKIDVREVRPEMVREHYDRLSHLYHALWGDHIHHGYWDGEQTPETAQLRLTELLADRARVARDSKVLDIGCGLGGSAVWLARNLGCRVLGLTNSPVQANLSTRMARQQGLEGRIQFKIADAECLQLPANSYDAVWIIESSEHLRCKLRFFRRCYLLLKPGGVIALCAWLAGENSSSADMRALVERICRGMLCPSFGTLREHMKWFNAVGFTDIEVEDCTRCVEKTWDYCVDLIKAGHVQRLLRIADEQTRTFVNCFADMRRAFAEGAMAYGMLVARKPEIELQPKPLACRPTVAAPLTNRAVGYD